MLESENFCSTSPATTPGSIDAAELLPKKHLQTPSKILHLHPLAIVIISSLQILLFSLSYKFPLKESLRFEPANQKEIWRFVTYMLVHSDWLHLTQNVLLQCGFAYHLEKHQKSWKVVVIYLASGFTGALGASCFGPEDVVGASAGVYGLLVAHLPHLIIDTQLKHKLYKLAGVITIVIFDIVFNVIHYYKMESPLISWGAHVFGAATGFLLGFLLFSDTGNSVQPSKMKKKLCHIIGATLYIAMLFVLFLVNYLVRIKSEC